MRRAAFSLIIFAASAALADNPGGYELNRPVAVQMQVDQAAGGVSYRGPLWFLATSDECDVYRAFFVRSGVNGYYEYTPDTTPGVAYFYDSAGVLQSTDTQLYSVGTNGLESGFYSLVSSVPVQFCYSVSWEFAAVTAKKMRDFTIGMFSGFIFYFFATTIFDLVRPVIQAMESI